MIYYELGKQLEEKGFYTPHLLRSIDRKWMNPSLMELISAIGVPFESLRKDFRGNWKAILRDQRYVEHHNPEVACAKLWLELQK